MRRMAAVVAGLAVVMLAMMFVALRKDAHAPAAQAQEAPIESAALFVGCNKVTLTWPNATPTTTVAAAVAPPGILVAIWEFRAGSGSFVGFSPDFPEVSDLRTVNYLDAVFVCVNAPGTLARPALAGGTSTTTPTATPAPTAAPPPPTVAPPPSPAPTIRACCKVCTTGKACGDTCIAANKTCHVGPGCACNAWAPNIQPDAYLTALYLPVDNIVFALNTGSCAASSADTADGN